MNVKSTNKIQTMTASSRKRAEASQMKKFHWVQKTEEAQQCDEKISGTGSGAKEDGEKDSQILFTSQWSVPLFYKELYH